MNIYFAPSAVEALDASIPEVESDYMTPLAIEWTVADYIEEALDTLDNLRSTWGIDGFIYGGNDGDLVSIHSFAGSNGVKVTGTAIGKYATYTYSSGDYYRPVDVSEIVSWLESIKPMPSVKTTVPSGWGKR